VIKEIENRFQPARLKHFGASRTDSPNKLQRGCEFQALGYYWGGIGDGEDRVSFCLPPDSMTVPGRSETQP
jgi:hypothetical protein